MRRYIFLIVTLLLAGCGGDPGREFPGRGSRVENQQAFGDDL